MKKAQKSNNVWSIKKSQNFSGISVPETAARATLATGTDNGENEQDWRAKSPWKTWHDVPAMTAPAVLGALRILFYSILYHSDPTLPSFICALVLPSHAWAHDDFQPWVQYSSSSTNSSSHATSSTLLVKSDSWRENAHRAEIVPPWDKNISLYLLATLLMQNVSLAFAE